MYFTTVKISIYQSYISMPEINEEMKNFFLYCIENGGKARRIDLALDDFDKLITPVENSYRNPVIPGG